MRKPINYESTIQSFFKMAISWLESRPVRLRDGVNKEKISYEYMKMVQSDPCQHTINNAVYVNCDKLDGFMFAEVVADSESLMERLLKL